jgi:L-amino acid N-acyltransferase YncA
MMLVRDTVLEDHASIHAIYAHHVLHGLASFEEVPPDAGEMRRRHDDVRAHGLPYLVAADGPDVLGFAYCSLFRTRSAYRFAVEDSVYVKPGQDRRGVGRALLQELIRRAEALGYRQIIAVIGDSANSGSIGLHASLGFLRSGLLRSSGYKLGRWVDTVLMQRPLGRGDGTAPRESGQVPAQPA